MHLNDITELHELSNHFFAIFKFSLKNREHSYGSHLNSRFTVFYWTPTRLLDNIFTQLEAQISKFLHQCLFHAVTDAKKMTDKTIELF